MSIEFESLFVASKGQPINYQNKELKMVDRVNLPATKVSFKLAFVSSDSKWEQGIVLQTKGKFTVNSQDIPNRMVLWENTAPKEVLVHVFSKDKTLLVYNVWKTEDGTTHYWHGGGAMYVEEFNKCRIYNCNGGYADDDLNDLVFNILF